MIAVKGRTIRPDRPVEVYRNLSFPAGPVYSIRQGGKVVAHARTIYLKDATFVVHEAGRQRVLEERRKNVHAWIRGRLLPEWIGTRPRTKVFYNPYEAGHFFDQKGYHLVGAERVVVDSGGVRAYRPERW